MPGRAAIDGFFRVGFVLYALLLTSLTHWPNLTIESGIPRTDLWAHFIAFFVLTILILSTGWIAPRDSWKNMAIGVPVAIAWAGLDELTQGLPGLHRHVTMDDFAANVIGVQLAAVCWLVFLAMWRRHSWRAATDTTR